MAFDIPGYRLVRQLGQGGMATVYLATQTALGRQVAIKLLAHERMPSEDLVKRFELETRTIARLDHPHIVDIYEVGRASTGQLFYTMPFLPNGDLSSRSYLQDPRGVVGVLRALAQALDYAHEQGIVHRDVKPENVLFDKLDRPLLADFGIALTTQASVRMTREGATLGSTGYMSPEQARGLAIDGRSDLYSLGVVGYELLTGDLPFQGPDPLAVALAHVEQAVPRLPPTRRLWQTFIDRCLAKEPAQRFQDARSLLLALDDIEATLDGRGAKTGAFHRLHDRLAGRSAGLMVGAAMLVGIAALLMLLRGAPQNNIIVRMPTADATTGAPTPPVVQGTDKTSAEVGLDSNAIESALAQGNALLRKHRLLAPAGDNAAESFLRVLKLSPVNAQARAGIDGIFNALEADFSAALARNDIESARTLIEQGRQLADSARMRGTEEYNAHVDVLLDDFNSRLRLARTELDPLAVAALQPVAGALSVVRPEANSAWQETSSAMAAVPPTGIILHDKGGPDVLLVPATIAGHHLDHAYALARTETTRAAYAEFVAATKRAPARCREPMRPLSRWKNLDWRDPDFPQGERDPAVCVSWQDAYAYARWLSERTGAVYRLPTEAEWLHAAAKADSESVCLHGNVADSSKDKSVTLASRYNCNDGASYTSSVAHYAANPLGLYDLVGNVSEWTLDCGVGAPVQRLMQPDACPERIFRGTSWRDGPDDDLLRKRGSSDPDVGYTTIGFRVLRELSLDKLPPSTAP